MKPDECTVHVALEDASTSLQLTRANWKAFRDIARLRMKSGLEVIPGMIGCPDLAQATAELKADPATRSSLRRAGISPTEYLQIGWALLVANDPELFNVRSNPVVTSNAAFIARHRVEVDSLLRGR
ncbi:MAG TPA: hypothetical protein VFQ67_02275 [Allosphingosinicella sp.]|jgi:hypothetical protein|nr:hypothetical protein [Allosphingosinicella sp.]